MKRFHKKSLVLLIAVALLLTCTISGTVAFLTVGSGPVTNTFTPVELDTKIIENDDFGSTKTKKSIQIQNNGNIDAYVRVAVYGNWVIKDENNKEKIVAPWDGNFTVGANWVKKDDKFYYYTEKLHPYSVNSELTSDLLGSDIEGTAKPEGYPDAYLVVTVVHQAIQTEPAAALTAAKWGWTPPTTAQ